MALIETPDVEGVWISRSEHVCQRCGACRTHAFSRRWDLWLCWTCVMTLAEMEHPHAQRIVIPVEGEIDT